MSKLPLFFVIAYDILKSIMTKKTNQANVAKSKKSSINKPARKVNRAVAETEKIAQLSNLPVDNSKLQMWNKKLFRLAIVIAIVAGIVYLAKNVFVVALVNNRPISRLAIIKQLEKSQGKLVLEQLVTETLITQATNKAGVKVEKEEINKTIQEIEESFKAQNQDLDSLLAMQGMTRSDLLKQIALQKKIEAILKDKAQVSDDEVAQYLEDSKDFLPEDKTEEELKTMAREQLVQQKMGEAFQSWMNDLKDKAKIQYFKQY